MSTTLRAPSTTTLLWTATALSLPQTLFYHAIFLHELFGIGGLYDALLVPLDHTLPGKLVTVACMLAFPTTAIALAAWVFRLDPRRRVWSAAMIAANLGLLAIISSYLLVESLHEMRPH